jgi:methylmalonyl-CoA decarboxylase
MALVEKTLTGKTGVLQLNRAEKHNSLNGDLMRELTAGLDDLAADGVRVIVIRAAPGVKVWSAGHDINEIPEPRRDPLGYFDALDPIFALVRECEDGRDVMTLLKGPICHAGFKRLN